MSCNIRTIRKIGFAFILISLMTGCSLHGKKVFQSDNVALQGFDPVAYFTKQKALRGDVQYQVKYDGVTWYFISEQHRKMFKMMPEAYIPQYGGYCSYAMSFGLVVSSDPHAFSIKKDKLYLNYSLNVREKWLRNDEYYIQKADGKWLKKI